MKANFDTRGIRLGLIGTFVIGGSLALESLGFTKISYIVMVLGTGLVFNGMAVHFIYNLKRKK